MGGEREGRERQRKSQLSCDLMTLAERKSGEFGDMWWKISGGQQLCFVVVAMEPGDEDNMVIWQMVMDWSQRTQNIFQGGKKECMSLDMNA